MSLSSVETSRKIQLTPEWAAQLKAKMAPNRRLSEPTVARYVAAMKNGEWVCNGEPIICDRDGRMIDGQQRVEAVIRSGVTIETWLTTGVPDGAFPTINTGRVRQARDVLDIAGHGFNSTLLAAAGKLMWGLEQGRPEWGLASGIPHADVLDVANRHPGLVKSISATRGMTALTKLLLPRISAFCHYVFGQIDGQDRDDFFQQLTDGAGLMAGGGTHRLRERLQANRLGSGKLTPLEMLALTIKGWNFFVAGEVRHNLRWRTNGPHEEPFPRIEGWKYPAGA